MIIFTKRFMEKFKQKRSQWLAPPGKFLLKLGISANVMTTISFLSALGAIYFLFNNHLYFVLLGIFHLIADAFDGVLARLSNPKLKPGEDQNHFGHYYDYVCDRMVTLLLLLKIGWFFQDYYAYLIAGVFVLAQLLYVGSRFKSPVLFTRTLMLILVMLQWNVLAYLATGIAAAYSLARELVWFVQVKQLKR